jgi:uncharacterized membrane protein YdbT with pleckstrin-like domain
VAEDDQERDVWWGAYASRAMLPSLIVATMLTLVIIGIAWHFDAFNRLHPLARSTAYLAIAVVWLVQLLRWGYRVMSFTYRLTTRQLLHHQGFCYPPGSAIELARIAEIRVEQGFWETWLHVGNLRIIFDQDNQGAVVLPGILHPERIADHIARQVSRARGQQLRLRFSPQRSRTADQSA